jgi:predicted ATPase
MLLVVDNVEHLLAEDPNRGTIADLLIEILQESERIKLLVTSREILNLQGEWPFEVEGLDFPRVEQEDGLNEYGAMALFIQRARRAYPEFELNPEDQIGVARLCRLVEGMPLAIELAATWVRLLSPAEIVREIENSLDFLNSQIRDLPERHRSMRAVFDHSWQRLPTDEGQVLGRLSVFRGGFDRQAAEHVARASLPILSSLVIRSLLRRTGAGRYDLHELIRQYAASKLADDPEEMHAAQERHSLYYLGLLEEQGVKLQSHHQKQAVAELTTDMDNIRAAWDWSIANHEFIRLYQVSARFMHLCEIRNWFKEAETTFRKTADALQASVRGSELDAAHQVALHAMLAHWGFFRFRLGKGEEAYHILSSSAAFLRKSTGPFAAIYSHLYLGIDSWILGKFSEANESLLASRKLAQECGARWHEAMDSEFLGRVAIEQGEYNQARQYLSEALAMLRQLGDPSMTAHTLSYLGRTMQSLGEYREAERLLREGLELSRENGYRFATALALDGLGRVAYAEGRYGEAQPFFSESASLFRDMGDTHRLSRTLIHRGLNSMALSDTVGAQDDLRAALNMAYAGGFTPAVLHALTGLAALEAQQKASQGTLEMVFYILQQPASTQETKNLATQLQMELEAKLPQGEIEAAHQHVASKNLDEVVLAFLNRYII